MVERDLAVVVKPSPMSAIMGAIRACLPSCCAMPCCLMCSSAVGKGVQVESAGWSWVRKSLAVRLTLGGHAPLTEADIDAAVQAVLAQLKARWVQVAWMMLEQSNMGGIEFAVESLETPALTKGAVGGAAV